MDIWVWTESNLDQDPLSCGPQKWSISKLIELCAFVSLETIWVWTEPMMSPNPIIYQIIIKNIILHLHKRGICIIILA